MPEFRPFAALSSGLLARKGQARPAMRPQPGLGQMLDDLGWNDMGAAHTPAPTLLSPMPLAEPARRPEPPVEVAPEPPVVIAAPETIAPSPRTATGAKAKAAFTLRLDPARHLRLRLACAVKGRSAQLIVTDALDHLLASLPEVESLAATLPASPGDRPLIRGQDR